MAVLLSDLKQFLTQVVGTTDANLPPSGGSEATRATEVCNQAGRHLFTRDWSFIPRRVAPLATLAPITISDGTWTTASKTLTKTGAFTSYTFAKGDLLDITDGTGASEGIYQIASRTSANAIVLTNDCGATDGSADIDATLSFPYITLPSDFGAVRSLRWNGTNGGVELTTDDRVMELRYETTTPNTNYYMACVAQSGQTSTTTAQGPMRLELDHAPSAASPDAMLLTYSVCWNELSGDTDEANVPIDVKALLGLYVRAFAEGYMNAHAEETGVGVVSLDERLHDIESGSTFNSLWEKYGSVQPSMGRIQNSAVSMARRSHMTNDLVTAVGQAVT